MVELPPKPSSRPDNAGWFERIKLFREDIFVSQPARLYRAWMAEMRTPFYRSFMVNDPKAVQTVLVDDATNFPKSDMLEQSLYGLLGQSIFVTNGETWARQRRIIDPAFDDAAKQCFPVMQDAITAAIERVRQSKENLVEVEFVASYLAADIIFRTLFSIPISDDIATKVFTSFRDYQRTQPLWNVSSLLRLPKWFSRRGSTEAEQKALEIRDLLSQLVDERTSAIANGNAPDDLATRIMTTVDTETGRCFNRQEMIDQVAIFFLAGHETSASALAWGLYLLAMHNDVQERVASEANKLSATPKFAELSRLKFTRDVFRETLRLYPSVPMFLRHASKQTEFRNRRVPKKSLVILSPWHLHRHERLWQNPDAFDPERWQTDEVKKAKKDIYMPFSKGPRVCTGAGFAMVEGVLSLAMLSRAFEWRVTDEKPIPVAHLTVRAKDGIYLRTKPRSGFDTTQERTL